MQHNVVFGYHGCSRTLADSILTGAESHLLPSDSKAEWLGRGVYFWENNYQRAMEWAQSHVVDDEPAVIGAIIVPGNCLDLLDSACLEALSIVAASFEEDFAERYGTLPEPNDDAKGYHPYDCALINYFREVWKDENAGRILNTVRGAFSEGRNIVHSSFATQNHIQWAVLTPTESILGYFRPTRAMMMSRL